MSSLVLTDAFPSRATTATTRLRLTSRGRAVLTTLAVLPLAFAAFLLALNGGPAVATLEGSTVPLESVTVETGQSLWTIAERLAPTADPREVISTIVELNRLSSVDVVPGQQLAIPSTLTHPGTD